MRRTRCNKLKSDSSFKTFSDLIKSPFFLSLNAKGNYIYANSLNNSCSQHLWWHFQRRSRCLNSCLRSYIMNDLIILTSYPSGCFDILKPYLLINGCGKVAVRTVPASHSCRFSHLPSSLAASEPNLQVRDWIVKFYRRGLRLRRPEASCSKKAAPLISHTIVLCVLKPLQQRRAEINVLPQNIQSPHHRSKGCQSAQGQDSAKTHFADGKTAAANEAATVCQHDPLKLTMPLNGSFSFVWSDSHLEFILNDKSVFKK